MQYSFTIEYQTTFLSLSFPLKITINVNRKFSRLQFYFSCMLSTILTYLNIKYG